MLDIVLASTNPGKIAEIKNLLSDLPIKIVPQSKFDIPPVEETGTTFVENAIIKARHAAKHSGLPAIADDSGLTVDALGGAPGVRSARYAGENASDEERIVKLLAELQKTGKDDRDACYHCVIALMGTDLEPAPLLCHGIWEGEILKEPRGDKGFGYDPVFYIPTHDCSVAELAEEEKNAISHRGQAMEQLIEVLEEIA